MFARPAPACRGAYMGRKRWAKPHDRPLLFDQKIPMRHSEGTAGLSFAAFGGVPMALVDNGPRHRYNQGTERWLLRF